MSIEWNFDEETQSRIQKALDLINLGVLPTKRGKHTLSKIRHE